MKIVVTGASSGIGKYLVETLALDGHEIWGLSRSTGCDVTDPAQLARAFDAIRSKWTTVDALICCAGIHGVVGPAMDADPRTWLGAVEANLAATYLAIHACFPLLAGDARKKVICFSGGGATGSRPMFSAYAVAKTGIVRLVEVLADEWRALPIDINSVAPGAIATRLTDEVIALGPDRAGESEYQQAQKTKAGGGGSLDKVAGLIAFLLSRSSDGVTGRLFAAQWDPWDDPARLARALAIKDYGKLRRIAE